MKKIFSIISIAAFVLISFDASAARRGDIKGKIVDESGEPAGYATVAIMAQDSTIVTGAMADENGYYDIPVAAGEYIVKVSLIGYKDVTTNIRIGADVVELPLFTLCEDATALNAAVVTENVKLVEMKVDKLVMNVSQSAFAQNSNGLELLRKAPGVTIDKDGNVKLNGKTVSVWIDGRPSHLDGKSLEALLRGTDGNTIDKFEIMEHPSAKYDAEGQGGIINIKTKKNLLSGLYGNVGGNGGGMYFKDIDKFNYTESAWATVNYRTNKTNTVVNLYESTSQMYQMQKVDITADPIRQYSESLLDVNNTDWNIKLANDWFINDKNTAGFIVTMPGSRSSLNSDKSFTEYYLNNTLQQKVITDILNPSSDNQVTGNLNFTHVFDEMKASELTANFDYYRNGSNSQSNTSYEGTPEFRNIASDQTLNIYSAKLDYQSVVFNFAMLEAGAKWALSMTDSQTGRDFSGVSNEDVFKYTENIGAAYVSLAAQMGPKFSAKLGLRGEYTNSLGDWISSGTQTPRSYFDVFPTLFVGYNPNENWRFNTSLTRRITRPRYNQLNPTEIYIDANDCIVGDPQLAPEYSTSVGFSAGYGQHLNLSLAYDYADKLHNQIPTYNSSTGEAIMKWGNFGVRHISLASFSVSELPITKWMAWTLSLTGMYVKNIDNNGFVNASPYANGYTCFTFMLPNDWKIQLDGIYSSNMAWGYYTTGTMVMSNLGIKKTIADGKFVLSLDIDDIFNSLNSDVKIKTDVTGMTSSIGQKPYMQMVKVGINYNFGKAQQSRYRKVGNLEEASRAGGSNKIGQ